MIINFKYGFPRQPDGLAKHVVYYGRPSQGVAPVAAGPPLTDNQILTLPVNCVVAGNQKEPDKKAVGLNGLTGAFKNIFRE